MRRGIDKLINNEKYRVMYQSYKGKGKYTSELERILAEDCHTDNDFVEPDKRPWKTSAQLEQAKGVKGRRM